MSLSLIRPQRLLLASPSTASGFAISAGGYLARTTLDTLPKIPFDSSNIALAQFLSQSAAGTAFTFRLGFYRYTSGSEECVTRDSEDVFAAIIASGTATLGTATGLSTTSRIPSTYRVAHTITSFALTTTTATPYGPGSFLAGEFGTVAVEYSPANNSQAALLIRNRGGWHGAFIDLAAGTGTNMNVAACVALV